MKKSKAMRLMGLAFQSDFTRKKKSDADRKAARKRQKLARRANRGANRG